MSARVRLGFAALAAAGACVAAPVSGQALRATARVSPAAVALGQRVRYTGYVLGDPALPSVIRWYPPDSSDALTWGPPRVTRRPGKRGAADTSMVEATLQAFQLGTLVLPGLKFIDQARAPGVVHQLPSVRLIVNATIAATDSTADLRPVRGPLKAPWWEVVPWLLAIGLGLMAALIAWLVRRLRRRPLAATQPAPRSSPLEAAFQQLEALRGRRLPEAGQFGQHAFELTVILRRYLEATATRLRPGFTTGELARRLEGEPLPADEAHLLVSLMKVWDRVKFARAEVTLDDARQSEKAVEAFLRRRRPPPLEKAA